MVTDPVRELPSDPVAVAERVADPAATGVTIIPVGFEGSAATVNFVGSEDVNVRDESVTPGVSAATDPGTGAPAGKVNVMLVPFTEMELGRWKVKTRVRRLELNCSHSSISATSSNSFRCILSQFDSTAISTPIMQDIGIISARGRFPEYRIATAV